MGKNLGVKGLANIGALLARNEEAAKPVLPKSAKQQRRDIDGIADKTMARITNEVPMGASATVVRRMLEAAIRDAYNLGHADAIDQNNVIETMLAKQYEARTQLTMPTVVGAVMEQLGMSSMVLDMASVATVFQRTRIEFQATDADTVEYKLVHLSDQGEPQ